MMRSSGVEGPGRDAWRGIVSGFVVGALPYHITYSLATKAQTGRSLHLRQVIKLAPLSGARTSAREMYRAPIRNVTRDYLQKNSGWSQTLVEFSAGTTAAMVDAVAMCGLDGLRIESSVKGESATRILFDRGLLVYYKSGFVDYVLKNMTIWPILLPVGRKMESYFQSRHPKKPLTKLEFSLTAIFAGSIASLASNLPELRRNCKQAGVEWKGFVHLARKRGLGALTKGSGVRAIQCIASYFLHLATIRRESK